MESVIVAIITSGLTLIGVIITNSQHNKQIENKLITAQAVTDTKLENLTAEVRKHNDFGSRIPILETEIQNLKEEVRRLKEV